jgi:purine-binding chemotaxis protein CheW
MSEIEQAVVDAEEKYVIFSVSGGNYAFPSRVISEVAVFDAVYPLPLMPDYVLGIINRYSVPYVLFDIGQLLFSTPSARGKVLVFKDNIDRIAFLIDNVSDIVDVPRDKLFTVERSSESREIAEMITASFKRDGGDVFVLDAERMLNKASGETAG